MYVHMYRYMNIKWEIKLSSSDSQSNYGESSREKQGTVKRPKIWGNGREWGRRAKRRRGKLNSGYKRRWNRIRKWRRWEWKKKRQKQTKQVAMRWYGQ